MTESTVVLLTSEKPSTSAYRKKPQLFAENSTEIRLLRSFDGGLGTTYPIRKSRRELPGEQKSYHPRLNETEIFGGHELRQSIFNVRSNIDALVVEHACTSVVSPMPL